MKRLLIASTALSLLGGAALAGGHVTQEKNEWYKAAQQELKAKMAVAPITSKAKNIILLIADGNGVGSNYATRLYQGQQKGGYGDENVMFKEQLPHLALVKTYNTNAQTPDSAGTGTAMHSGVKTKAGVVGVDETLNRGDCSAVASARVDSIAEILSGQGKAVGVVSTARLTHATPASAYAHAADRNFEDDSKLPEDCTTPDIASQLITAMDKGIVDLAMGGGRRHFLPKEATDEEGKNGKRTDGKNLIETARSSGVQYAWDDVSAKRLKLDGSPILALFESSHMKYEHDRTGEPSLAEMTEKAIKALSNDKDGYFLSIEAGRVDHASHDSNLHRTVTDGVAFDEVVRVAMEMTSPEDTLIIVTADHEHALAFNGYCGRGTPITGLCYGINADGEKHTGELNLANDGKPYSVATFANGIGSILSEGGQGSRPVVTQDEAVDPDYVQQALIPLDYETHSGEDVAVYARGPWAHLLNGTVEQNFIFHVMMQAAHSH
ncbi:alkaline phosphatase [Kiloniella sp. b19]|uniref:alkaline phosphatase n=1 Tax=Kiloniella sp. GXU_MW_B19 TaxID=3141326 RepID=UPI0031E2D297